MAVTRIPIPAWAKTQEADERLALSLSEIDLIVRTVNCLEDEGIFTVAGSAEPHAREATGNSELRRENPGDGV